MSANATTPDVVAAPAPRASLGGRAGRLLRSALRTRRGQIGLLLTLLVVAVAFLGPLFADNPTALHGSPFEAPGGIAGPLGGDSLGRSVLDRVLDGGWRILLISAAATALAIVLGSVSGVVAAYRGGFADTVIMRTVDVLLGIPSLVFVLMLVSVVGSHAWLVIIGVGLTQAPQVARVLRAAAQDVSERDYVKAVAAWGVPPRTVIRRHVIPSLLTPLMVECALRLSFSIILVASLSFLGLGTQPPTADWGVMINENRVGLSQNVWGVLAPAILLAVLAVGTNMFSDAIARANLSGGAAGDPTLQMALTSSNVAEGDEPVGLDAIDEGAQ
ncbi:MAG TPA: ABC transporter permease [Solirubrobacterales bacterium]|nr:ABC transporter permease [Solirubrobacterales bacterium]